MAIKRAATLRHASPLAAAVLIAAVAASMILIQADLLAPPRYDGAGYSVLARSLAEGTGYRAIDHPDRPRHSHFPPGYPAALALLWSTAGPSAVSAHLFSALCTVLATLAAWSWFRRCYPREVAFVLGLALSVNWIWSRSGSAIQSEPLYELLSQLAILVALRIDASSRRIEAVALGTILSACLLTRHVGFGVVMAVILDVFLRGGRSQARASLLTTGVILTPWVAWLVWAGGGQRTQAGLLVAGSADMAARVGSQALFYLLRIPDQITGPFVEVATVIRPLPHVQIPAKLWAAAASAVIITGWLRVLRTPRRRLAGLIPLTTLPLLLIWPYTEAGRFLVPLIPCLLIGAVEGMRFLLRFAPRRKESTPSARRQRLRVSLFLLALSIPYTAYSLRMQRTRAADPAERAFDAACVWLARNADRSGPVLTRHPGEVFLRTGRQALEVSTSERPGDRDAAPAYVASAIHRYGVTYLLVDEDRYLNAPAGPLGSFVRVHPERVRKVASWEGGRSSVALYEVLVKP